MTVAVDQRCRRERERNGNRAGENAPMVLTIRTDSAVVGSVKRTSGGRTKNTRGNRGQGKNTYSGARVDQERHIVALVPDVQKATDRCGGWASRSGRSYGLA